MVRSPNEMPPSRMRRTSRIVLLVVGVLVAALLVVPFVIPVGPAPDTVDPRELAYPNSRFVEVDGVDFHYMEYGARDSTCTIVLLHGFGANTASWSRVAPLLASDCRVVAFDRPAFGLTERPSRGSWTSGNPYSVDAHAEQTIRLMDALDIERAVVVGHSAGATVATLAARLHPERVAALVLEDPAVYEDRYLEWAMPVLRAPPLRRIGPLLVRRFARSTADSLLARAHYDPSVATTELADGYLRPFSAIDWDRALWEFATAPRSRAPADALRELTVPVLVIAGRQDRIVPLESAERASREIDGALLITYDRTGHVPHEERPERFAADVRTFVRSQLSQSGQ